MGRPKDPMAGVAKTVRAPQDDWDYAGLFLSGDNESAQFREAMLELRKFRPVERGADGVLRFKPITPKRKNKQRIPYAKVDAYAKAHPDADGQPMTRNDAIAEILKQALK